MNNKRIENEIKQGKYISQKGEEIWNWSSPAGKLRWKRRVNIFCEFLGNENKKILEIGCGTGLFTDEIAKTKNKIIAIDVSPDLLKIAKKRVTGKNVTFKIENAYKTTFPKNYFDFIVGSSVLHHLEIDSALREFYRILKPSGKIIFTEPNMLNPQVAMERNIPFIRKLANNSPDETAFFRWSLKKKLLKHGLTGISIKPFDFLHPAIPSVLIGFILPILKLIEYIPLLKEIAGSLIIKAKK